MFSEVSQEPKKVWGPHKRRPSNAKGSDRWLWGHPYHIAAPSFLVYYSIILMITQSISPILSEPSISANSISSNYQFSNRNSGQFTIAELCQTKSQIPAWKRVEGAVLLSTTEVDINCTIIFKTRSSQQHFVVRFEELKLDCNDHLKLFDGDMNYGQPSIKDYSCRDNIANVQPLKTTSTYLTVSYTSDRRSRPGDGFKLVATAVYNLPRWECPPDYSLCRNDFCISKSLFCDGVNHCMDNSDELNCGYGHAPNGWFFDSDLNLSNALGLLVVLVLIISACVIIFISAVYCRRDNHYAQYQHHLQRAIGVPLQTSSSLMFANAQPQYQYFQPSNFSPYVTPQHAIATATLPAGYSTLPLNLVRQRQPHQPSSPILAKANNLNAPGYFMMAGLTRPPTVGMQGPTTVQTNLFMPTSQSILSPAAASRGLIQTQTEVRR